MICSQHYKEVSGKLELIHKKLLKDAHRRKWKEADWTDETDQLVLILQSLLHCKAEVTTCTTRLYFVM